MCERIRFLDEPTNRSLRRSESSIRRDKRERRNREGHANATGGDAVSEKKSKEGCMMGFASLSCSCQSVFS